MSALGEHDDKRQLVRSIAQRADSKLMRRGSVQR